MRAVRFLSLALLLIAGLAGTASAQTYNNTPGVYTDVAVGIVPAALPPGSLPSDVPALGPDLYRGTLTITRSADGTYSVSYRGETADRARLQVSATFDSDWAGIKLGELVVGTSLESNVITGIDGANLLSARVNGVGTVAGSFQRVMATFSGDGSTYPPTLVNISIKKAPGYLR
ncbi:MAG: hypothetical protein ABIP29_00690 [Candidatus Eisenbacteria bacterium]